MPSRDEYEAELRQIQEPYLSDPDRAWLGFYRALLWFEHEVPHIIDGDKLVKGTWRARAERVWAYVADQMGCSVQELEEQVDRLVKSPIFSKPPQRHNPLGIGFVSSLFIALGRFAGEGFEFFPEEAIGQRVFTGIRESPRSRPDIVVVREGRELSVISAKWSIRHDRLKDVIDEAGYFKTLMGSLKFYIVTNEFDPARLDKLLGDYRVDSVFHVHKPLIVDVAELDGRMAQLRDLGDLLRLYQ